MDQRVLVWRGLVAALVALSLVVPGVLAEAPPVGAQDPGPSLTVTPATGLVDDQTVVVSGSGFLPDTTIYVVSCPPGVTDGLSCDIGGYSTATSDADGSFTAEYEVSRRLFPNTGPTTFDCLGEACRIGAGDIDQVRTALAPISFAVPELTVSLAEHGTLESGTNDAVARANVTCDLATPVSVAGTVAQPDLSSPSVEGGFGFSNVACEPGDPLVAFIPTRDLTVENTTFTLGSAEASVAAAPYRSFDDGPAVEATGTVELLDYDAVVAAIQSALEDPANTELRETLGAATRDRFAQDPVFRQEFIAALHG